MDRIEWRRGLADSTAGRLSAYAMVGGATGIVLLAGLLALASLPALVALFVARPGAGALVVLFVLVGGPLSVLYLWPLLTDATQRRPIVAGSWLASLPVSDVAVATVVGACVHALAFRATPAAPFFVLVAGGLVGVVGSWLFLMPVAWIRTARRCACASAGSTPKRAVGAST